MISVLIPGWPLPQGSKKIGIYKKDGVVKRSIIDANPALKQWRLQVTSYIREAMAQAIPPLTDALDKPMEVVIVFYFPRPQSHYGTGRNAGILKPGATEWPIKPPDIDKLMRAIFDGATDAGLWLDDAQVVDVHAVKRWARQRPGVSLTVYPKEKHADPSAS